VVQDFEAKSLYHKELAHFPQGGFEPPQADPESAWYTFSPPLGHFDPF
jgi:hypothetical protein